jgi:hypothetical protein
MAVEPDGAIQRALCSAVLARFPRQGQSAHKRQRFLRLLVRQEMNISSQSAKETLFFMAVPQIPRRLLGRDDS